MYKLVDTAYKYVLNMKDYTHLSLTNSLASLKPDIVVISHCSLRKLLILHDGD